MRPIRVPNRSEEIAAGDRTALETSGHIKGKYTSKPGTLFQPKADRKNLMKSVLFEDTQEINAYFLYSSRSKLRIAIGKFMFSHFMERFFFCLIVVFAALVLVGVALKDDLGEARIYVLSVELSVLAIFLLELILKLFAVGCVTPIQVFFKDCWNVVDCAIVITSIALTVVEILPDVNMGYVQISSLLRLFRLVITFRKTNEFRRIHHKYRKKPLLMDFSVELASERVIELLEALIFEPWVQSNPPLLREVQWCIEVIASHTLYDPIVTLKKEHEAEKEQDLVNLVKIYSSTSHPGANSTIQSKRRSSSLQRNGTSISDLTGLSEEVIHCLEQIDSDSFDVFRLKELTEGKELFTLVYVFFARTDLCLTTNLGPAQLRAFMAGVQAAYHGENPYHNATHAADVLQSLHYFFGTCGTEEYLSTSPLELAGAYLAAAVHDMDHPGLTNSYLIGTQSKLAFRYNDRTVLENHHIASAFALTMEEDKDLFLNLTPEDYKHIREIMIEMVLSTDIAQHFAILTKFRAKFLNRDSAITVEDRILGLDLLLHAADISNPTRAFPTYRRWVSLIMKEFWAQGDQERARGLEVSYMMDRYTVNVAKSQIGFIDVIVAPVFEVLKAIRPRFEVSYGSMMSNREVWMQKVNDLPFEEESRTVTEMSHELK